MQQPWQQQQLWEWKTRFLTQFEKFNYHIRFMLHKQCWVSEWNAIKNSTTKRTAPSSGWQVSFSHSRRSLSASLMESQTFNHSTTKDTQEVNEVDGDTALIISMNDDRGKGEAWDDEASFISCRGFLPNDKINKTGIFCWWDKKNMRRNSNDIKRWNWTQSVKSNWFEILACIKVSNLFLALLAVLKS